MAAKGKASVSATGASMSKYDVEVEARLKALEANVNVQSIGGASVDGDKLAALEAKVNLLIEILNDNPLVVQHCQKLDGKRQISI